MTFYISILAPLDSGQSKRFVAISVILCVILCTSRLRTGRLAVSNGVKDEANNGARDMQWKVT
jgi:hypothetical protein